MFIEAHGQSVTNSLRYAALQVDKIRYFNHEPLDWVRFIQNNSDSPDDFYKLLPRARADTIYCSDRIFSNSNFYCHPEIFSILGNAYKFRSSGATETDEHVLEELIVKSNIRVELLCL